MKKLLSHENIDVAFNTLDVSKSGFISIEDF